MARRKKSPGLLTPLELKIMQVLWETGPSTVAEVQERLASPLAYNSVQTMLGVLLRKKKVKRNRSSGRAFSYHAVVNREGAVGSALGDMVTRMFGGSAEALLMALIDTRQVTAEEIARAARHLPSEKDD